MLSFKSKFLHEPVVSFYGEGKEVKILFDDCGNVLAVSLAGPDYDIFLVSTRKLKKSTQRHVNNFRYREWSGRGKKTTQTYQTVEQSKLDEYLKIPVPDYERMKQAQATVDRLNPNKFLALCIDGCEGLALVYSVWGAETWQGRFPGWATTDKDHTGNQEVTMSRPLKTVSKGMAKVLQSDQGMELAIAALDLKDAVREFDKLVYKIAKKVQEKRATVENCEQTAVHVLQYQAIIVDKVNNIAAIVESLHDTLPLK